MYDDVMVLLTTQIVFATLDQALVDRSVCHRLQLCPTTYRRRNFGSALQNLAVERWRIDDTSVGRSRGRSPDGKRSGSGSVGGEGATESGLGMIPAGGNALYSDGFNGDGYDDMLGGGMPPRTAFLNRDEQSEDSRLLQQILKESEDDIAASVADRTRGGSRGNASAGLAGEPSVSEIASAGGGAASDFYGIEELLASVGNTGGLNGDADDALQSLDVDRIIESMELEADDEADEAAASSMRAVPWRARRRSFTADGTGGASDVRGRSERQDWNERTPTQQATPGPQRGRASSTSAHAGAAPSTSTAAGGLDNSASTGHSRRAGAPGSTSLPYTVAAIIGVPWEADGEEPGARTRRRSPGRRPSVGSVSMAGVGAGDGKGVNGVGGDGGLTGPLGKAEAAELKLLRGGNREMVSPLQVKRRMRAPPQSPGPGQQSLAGGMACGSGGGGGGGGVVRMENLDAASRQLARNAAYGKHGPGVCTVTSAHSKFIAVGTSRGLILLFDHFQVRDAAQVLVCGRSRLKTFAWTLTCAVDAESSIPLATKFEVIRSSNYPWHMNVSTYRCILIAMEFHGKYYGCSVQLLTC